MSDDNASMISGRQYLEFAAPAVECVGKPFGGSAFHSCGNWSDKVEAIKKIAGLRMAGRMVMLASISSRLSRAGTRACPYDLPPAVLDGGFASFQTPQPRSVKVWNKRRAELRKTLRRLLGDLPELFTPKVTIQQRLPKDGYNLERFTFENGAGHTVYGYVLIPSGSRRRRPAILYHHYHGGKYKQGKEEVISRAFAKLNFATGEALAREGYVVLCIDAYAFGQRRFQGPAGKKEEGRKTETSLFKMFLWQGQGKRKVSRQGP